MAIHVIAERATVDGTGTAPAVEFAELAKSARLTWIVHPGQAAPESQYRPSQVLADYVRCRDLTCRFPGCDKPAIGCELDHTIAYGDGGRTHASNLKCLCTLHHLVKTFWGWRDQQLHDGTVIWTSLSGHTYITTPGSALLFPSLCLPTGMLAVSEIPIDDRGGDRTAMMPTRTRTRAQDRAQRVALERRHNRNDRLTPKSGSAEFLGPAPPDSDNDDPSPF